MELPSHTERAIRRLPRAFWVALCGICLAPDPMSAQPARGLDLQVQVLDVVVSVEATIGSTNGITVKQVGGEVHIRLSADILFDFDKADIRPTAVQALHQAADLIRDGATSSVRVEGHTDSKGGGPYNQQLSQRRAEAVRSWLIHDEDLHSVKFVTVGFGASRPVAPNTIPGGADNPTGRQQNRRVELIFGKRPPTALQYYAASL
jgi:outer membrane protein OmpA-like peptidoglycan-associated protein